MLATDRANEAIVADAAPVLARYGLQLDPATCVQRESWIGTQPHPYRWCPLVVVAPGAGG